MAQLTYAQAKALLSLDDALLQAALTTISGQNVDGTAWTSPQPLLPGATGSAATQLTNASGNQANANATATLTGSAGVFTWLTGFEMTGGGSTAGLAVSPTITGLISGTLTYAFVFPIGPLVPAQPLVVQFSTPIRSSAVNTNIVATLPAGGAGNTVAATVLHGFLL